MLLPLWRVFTIIHKKQTFFKGTYCYSCSVFTVCATCNVTSAVKYVLYFYISTSHSMCVVPNMAVFFCNFLISCFPVFLLRYCLSDYGMVYNNLFMNYYNYNFYCFRSCCSSQINRTCVMFFFDRAS